MSPNDGMYAELKGHKLVKDGKVYEFVHVTLEGRSGAEIVLRKHFPNWAEAFAWVDMMMGIERRERAGAKVQATS